MRQRFDVILLILLSMLLLLGLVFLSSASSVVGLEKFQDGFYFLKRQLLYGVLPGSLLFILFALLPYRYLRRAAFPFFIGSLILLVLVFVPGIGEHYGKAHSWITLAGFSFQPSEIAKLALLVYLASWCAKRREQGIGAPLLPFLVSVGMLVVLLFLQPDIGTMTVVVLSALAMYVVAGGRVLHIALVALAGTIGLVILIYLAPYRIDRLNVFLHPALDPQGKGYQINQALIAIGSGGLWGKGLGLSRQKFLYLPEVISDSLFAIMAEELGFVLMCGFLILLGSIALRGLRVARGAPDTFGQLLSAGIVALIVIQAFANMGSMMGLFPLTGLPLPLMSYGGTSMVMTLAALGILINISRYSRKS